jgi:hypothetical protein
MFDILTFRRMIAPAVVETLFDVACLVAVVAGIATVVAGIRHHQGRAVEIMVGFAIVIFGPLIARLYCERLILAFRIHDSLTEVERLAAWIAERSYALGDDETQ